MKQIIPCLWFNDQAEEAVEFYSSVFGNTKKLRTDYYTEAGKEQHGHNSGDVMTVEFEIHGQRFVSLNGGPLFKFTPAISFFFCCKSIAITLLINQTIPNSNTGNANWKRYKKKLSISKK